jgi:hypothetical protein
LSWNGNHASESTAIVPSFANAIAGSLPPLLFDGVPDPANAGPIVKPEPVGSHVPNRVVLLNEVVDALPHE